NEDAAQKRVTRALEKLHALLKQRGVVSSAAALAAVLGADAVTAAPAGLSATISSAAVTAAAGTGPAIMLLKLMAATKIKIGIVGAMLAAGVIVPLCLQQQARAKLREEDLSLQQQTEQLAVLQTEHERLANLATSAALSKDQLDDLQKLR